MVDRSDFRPFDLAAPKIGRHIATVVLALVAQLAPISASTAGDTDQGDPDPRRRVLITSRDLSTPDSQELLWRLRDTLARRDDVLHVDLPTQFDRNPLQNMERLNDALERGIRALDEGHAERAEPLLANAMSILPGWRSQLPATRRGMLALARAEFALGRPARAARALVLLLRFDPDFELPPEETSPKLHKTLAAARKIIAKEDTGIIRFHPTQKGAGVFLNGEFVGLAPLAEHRVPAAVTHVRVSADPRHHWVKTTRVLPTRPLLLQPRLRPTEGGDRYLELVGELPASLDAPTAPAKVGELAAWAGAQEIILFEVDDAQIEAVRYSPTGGEVLRRVGIERSERPTQELADELIGSLYATGSASQ